MRTSTIDRLDSLQALNQSGKSYFLGWIIGLVSEEDYAEALAKATAYQERVAS